MSSAPFERDRPAEVVAGLMAAAAIFAGLVAIAYRPFRIAPFAVLIALIACGIGGRHSRLAAFAVGVASAGWVIGMIVAVLTRHPMY
jgi:hypothetical protein